MQRRVAVYSGRVIGRGASMDDPEVDEKTPLTAPAPDTDGSGEEADEASTPGPDPPESTPMTVGGHPQQGTPLGPGHPQQSSPGAPPQQPLPAAQGDTPAVSPQPLPPGSQPQTTPSSLPEPGFRSAATLDRPSVFASPQEASPSGSQSPTPRAQPGNPVQASQGGYPSSQGRPQPEGVPVVNVHPPANQQFQHQNEPQQHQQQHQNQQVHPQYQGGQVPPQQQPVPPHQQYQQAPQNQLQQQYQDQQQQYQQQQQQHPRQQELHYPSQPPQRTVKVTHTSQSQPLITNCPQCHAGVLNKQFSLLGILLGIFCFPCGLICCFLMRESKCSNCGMTI